MSNGTYKQYCSIKDIYGNCIINDESILSYCVINLTASLVLFEIWRYDLSSYTVNMNLTVMSCANLEDPIHFKHTFKYMTDLLTDTQNIIIGYESHSWNSRQFWWIGSKVIMNMQRASEFSSKPATRASIAIIPIKTRNGTKLIEGTAVICKH